jgi:Zn-finger nucleic acid-binding protein
MVCPQCKERVAAIENMMPKIIVFFCPRCGNRWSGEEPGVAKQ